MLVRAYCMSAANSEMLVIVKTILMWLRGAEGGIMTSASGARDL